MDKPGTALPRFNSLWVGRDLKYLERLCLQSARAAGHEFVVWSYEPEKLGGVPDGFEVRDAAEVMPEERLLRYRDTGAVALGANLWRIELLAKGLGYWVDLDFIFLKPFDLAQPYVFGWEHAGWVSNGVMLAPPGTPFIRDLQSIPQPNVRPPWFGPKRTLAYYWRRLREGDLGIEDMPWGTYSVGLLTYCVKKHKLEQHVVRPEVFYPVEWKNAKMIYGPAAEVEALVQEDTRAVHMWHSRLHELVHAPPPEGSYVDMMCKRFGVATDDAVQA